MPDFDPTFAPPGYRAVQGNGGCQGCAFRPGTEACNAAPCTIFRRPDHTFCIFVKTEDIPMPPPPPKPPVRDADWLEFAALWPEPYTGTDFEVRIQTCVRLLRRHAIAQDILEEVVRHQAKLPKGTAQRVADYCAGK